MDPNGKRLHHLPRVRVERRQVPGGPASLFPVCAGPRLLSDHCPGHLVGASLCYPGSMTLVLRIVGRRDFSFSDLSAPLLAPPPTRSAPHYTEVLVNRFPVSCGARGMCAGVLCAHRLWGREGIQRSPRASEASAVLVESRSKEGPGLQV